MSSELAGDFTRLARLVCIGKDGGCCDGAGAAGLAGQAWEAAESSPQREEAREVI